MRLEVDLTDGRRRAGTASPQVDLVHAAMGELEASHLGALGFEVAIDEPYQHYQFAERPDIVAWSREHRSLLHIENRTRFLNLQEVAGSYNAKRAYLPGVLAERIGLPGSFRSVTHALVAMWSADVLHTVRIHKATFQAMCPDPMVDLERWWHGDPPERRSSSTFVLLDPFAAGRARQWIGLEDALGSVRPRMRDYAEAAARLKSGARAVAR